MAILVTGAAGFIGFHVAKRLLDRGETVIGLDNLNGYYDPALKADRLAILQDYGSFRFVRRDLADREGMAALFGRDAPQTVIHLGAQAGVRYSLEAPHSYVDSNLVGFANVLEGCRHARVQHLVFASTSSVYGASRQMPFSPHHVADHPLTLYAATKKANEAMAHAYAHLFAVPATGLRFFTVYGPWGRPDMALFKFVGGVLRGEPIDVYGHGQMKRDFTYIDDIAGGVMAAHDAPPLPDPAWDAGHPDPASSGVAPYRLYNIGNSRPVDLMRYIALIEERLGRKARLNLMPMQPGDVAETQADITDTTTHLAYTPETPVETGVPRFVDWYLQRYGTGQG